MVDIDTHTVVDLINSRDCADVTEWLKSFPSLEIVSRDGSITYANAITQSHPNALQVSDRFHLLQNLTKYGKEYLKNNLELKIKVPSTTEPITLNPSQEKQLLKKLYPALPEKIEIANNLLEQGHSKHFICKQVQMDIRTFEKISTMDSSQQEEYFSKIAEKVHEERVVRKQSQIDEVRNLNKQGISKRSISSQTGLSRATVSRYLDESTTAIHNSYGQKKKSILDSYLDEIKSFMEQKYTSVVIETKLREKGYTGSSSTLRYWITKLKKSSKESEDDLAFEYINRNVIISLLFHPIEKVKGLSQQQLNQIFALNPGVKEVLDLVNNFKEILRHKNVAELDNWIQKAQQIQIYQMNSFANGITRDIAAVKNAIIYNYNNGLAEGIINKVKVIKRIMFGRCSFDLLRKKILMLEDRKKSEFN